MTSKAEIQKIIEEFSELIPSDKREFYWKHMPELTELNYTPELFKTILIAGLLAQSTSQAPESIKKTLEEFKQGQVDLLQSAVEEVRAVLDLHSGANTDNIRLLSQEATKIKRILDELERKKNFALENLERVGNQLHQTQPNAPQRSNAGIKDVLPSAVEETTSRVKELFLAFIFCVMFFFFGLFVGASWEGIGKMIGK